MTDDELIGTEGIREPVDIARARKAFSDLQNGVSHATPCRCPACCYAAYVANCSGRKIDRLSFFLYWLEGEVQVSKVDQTVILIPGRRGERRRIKDFRELSRVKGVSEAISNFLLQHFQVTRSPRAVRLKLWRFKRSGIQAKVEGIRIDQDPRLREWEEAARPDRQRLYFAGRVARYIKSRPGGRASSRELLRHFSDKRIDDLEEILPLLEISRILPILRGRSLFFERVPVGATFMVRRERRRGMIVFRAV